MAIANCKNQDISSPERALDTSALITECERLFCLSQEECIREFRWDRDPWVMVPPKSDLVAGTKPTAGAGSTSYDAAGHFKIHISVSPAQMKQVLANVLEMLYQEKAPLVGLKFQSELMLNKEHQIGKQFALIFSKETEQNEVRSHAVEQLLAKLQRLFIEKGIEPEKGMVLTPETREQIARLPEGEQELEKKNLERRKYDRQIPGSKYFCYRNEDCIPADDTEDWIAEMTPSELRAQNMVSFTELDKILTEKPEKMHNPLGLSDPYQQIDLSR